MHVAINGQLVSFTASYRNAGVSRYTYRLVEGLARAATDEPTDGPLADQRYTVFVTRRDRDAVASVSEESGGHVRLVASQRPTERPERRILWEQTALPGLLRDLRVDVFHSPVNVLPLRRLPCASVVTIHDLAFLHYPQYYRRAKRFYQRTFTTRSARAATLVIAVSESTRHDIIERTGAAPDRVRVVYPAIDARFQPVADPARLAAFREEHHLPPRFLLYLGTLEPRKNVEGLVRAYAQLLNDAPETPPLVLAGAQGWFYQTLYALVRTLGLERAVTFAGYVRDDEQPLWYAAAELFIYPSFFEGFGLPVAEAMACGTPVITSGVSSLPEVAGEVAVQINPADPSRLAHAMRRLLQDADERRWRAAEGPRWASQFSVERMVRGCGEVYAEAARWVPGRASGRPGERGTRLVEVE
ncbi:MAG TPA: glycosyltransferase family 1 protein [Ktedonobacterales bacterium]|jgi:glycosyltransferase involved in cell wall biosynthesis